MTGAQPWRTRTVAAAAVLLLAWAWWWLEAPYLGFEHDAVFYAAEAMRRLDPSLLARDPFFAYGSQGDFSLFIRPYAALIAGLGPDLAAFWVTLVLRCAWALALWWLIRGFVPAATAAVVLAVLLMLPRHYDPASVFSAAEPFATPRLAAEALSWLSLGLLARTRRAVASSVAWLAALTFALVAAAMHPLMGWPVMLIVVLVLSARRGEGSLRLGWIAWAAVVAVSAGLAAAWAGLPLASRLLQRYDDAWWAIVQQRNAVVLASCWDPSSLIAAFAVPGLLALASVGAAPALRRLSQAAALTVLAGLVAWAWGSWQHNVLFVQLQTWRVLWLGQLLVPLVWLLRLGPAAWSSVHGRSCALLLVAIVLAPGSAVAGLSAALAVEWLAADRLDRWMSPTRRQLMAAVLLVLVLLWRAASLPALSAYVEWTARPLTPWLQVAAWEPALKLASLAIVGALALRATRAMRWGALALVAGTAIGSSAYWLATARQQLYAADDAAAAVRALIPRDATVYSGDELSFQWLRLQRANYVGNQQGASVLFYRPMAIELSRRLGVLAAQGLMKGPAAWPIERSQAPLDAAQARRLCTDPALDVILLPGRQVDAHRVVAEPGTVPRSLFFCDRWRSSNNSKIP